MTEPQKIRNLIDLFSQVRQRPGLYLGTNTITKLYDYLQGYRIAYQLNEINNPVDKNFFDNFTQFVYTYYNVVTNDTWSQVILEQCFGNEETALTVFFELIDLFIDDAKPENTKRIVLDYFDKLVYDQPEMRERFGNNFPSLLSDIMELIKDNAITNFKCNFDFILEQLNEKAEQLPELKGLLEELASEPSN